MNSGELRVDVPLACGESDCEDGSGNSLVNTPSKNADNKLKTAGNGSKKPPLSTSPRPNYEGGGSDSLTGSLEDLVSSFDEKLTMCFQDYQEQVDKIAPVQVSIGVENMYEVAFLSCSFSQNFFQRKFIMLLQKEFCVIFLLSFRLYIKYCIAPGRIFLVSINVVMVFCCQNCSDLL